jgi:hypothetical protein
MSRPVVTPSLSKLHETPSVPWVIIRLPDTCDTMTSASQAILANFSKTDNQVEKFSTESVSFERAPSTAELSVNRYIEAPLNIPCLAYSSIIRTTFSNSL